MLFNTIDFVIFFIVVLTTFSIVKKGKFQHIFLVAASYFFFYYTSNYLIVLLIFTTIWDFYFGEIIYKAKTVRLKKIVLTISLAGNLGLLGFFKYADFAIAQINFLGSYFDLQEQIPLLHLALPIAISFYTFHSITYTVGIYRGHLIPVKSFTDYAIFVAFFPQLVAGPILRARDFLPQLREKIDEFQIGTRLRQIVIQNSNLKFGVSMMALGFFKKMFFADNIAPLVNEIFANPVGHDSFAIVLATIGFGIQIYSDFSGYSDIAIGAALIMGFRIPMNFNKPYFAISPADFWRRWHVSLSTWLRDYLYIPLGGNRKSNLRTYFNLMIVMFLGGLWHGASWNFVIWGLLHGSYLSCHRIIANRFPNLVSNQFFRSKAGKLASILITQYLVFLAWIPFRIENSEHMTYAIQKYLILDIHSGSIIPFLISHKLSILFIILFIILHIISYKKNILEKIAVLPLHWWTCILIIIATSIIFFYDGNSEDFIYFRF